MQFVASFSDGEAAPAPIIPRRRSYGTAPGGADGSMGDEGDAGPVSPGPGPGQPQHLQQPPHQQALPQQYQMQHQQRAAPQAAPGARRPNRASTRPGFRTVQEGRQLVLPEDDGMLSGLSAGGEQLLGGSARMYSAPPMDNAGDAEYSSDAALHPRRQQVAQPGQHQRRYSASSSALGSPQHPGSRRGQDAGFGGPSRQAAKLGADPGAGGRGNGSASPLQSAMRSPQASAGPRSPASLSSNRSESTPTELNRSRVVPSATPGLVERAERAGGTMRERPGGARASADDSLPRRTASERPGRQPGNIRGSAPQLEMDESQYSAPEDSGVVRAGSGGLGGVAKPARKMTSMGPGLSPSSRGPVAARARGARGGSAAAGRGRRGGDEEMLESLANELAVASRTNDTERINAILERVPAGAAAMLLAYQHPETDLTALHEAVAAESLEAAALLLAWGAHPDASWEPQEGPPPPLPPQDDGDEPGQLPPIMYAVQSGNAKMVKLLLENGANVNAHDSRHYTLLHYACAGGHRNIIKLLLVMGASMFARTLDGMLPQQLAATERIRTLFRKLEEYHQRHGLMGEGAEIDPDMGEALPALSAPLFDGDSDAMGSGREDVPHLVDRMSGAHAGVEEPAQNRRYSGAMTHDDGHIRTARTRKDLHMRRDLHNSITWGAASDNEALTYTLSGPEGVYRDDSPRGQGHARARGPKRSTAGPAASRGQAGAGPARGVPGAYRPAEMEPAGARGEHLAESNESMFQRAWESDRDDEADDASMPLHWTASGGGSGDFSGVGGREGDTGHPRPSPQHQGAVLRGPAQGVRKGGVPMQGSRINNSYVPSRDDVYPPQQEPGARGNPGTGPQPLQHQQLKHIRNFRALSVETGGPRFSRRVVVNTAAPSGAGAAQSAANGVGGVGGSISETEGRGDPADWASMGHQQQQQLLSLHQRRNMAKAAANGGGARDGYESTEGRTRQGSGNMGQPGGLTPGSNLKLSDRERDKDVRSQRHPGAGGWPDSKVNHEDAPASPLPSGQPRREVGPSNGESGDVNPYASWTGGAGPGTMTADRVGYLSPTEAGAGFRASASASAARAAGQLTSARGERGSGGQQLAATRSYTAGPSPRGPGGLRSPEAVDGLTLPSAGLGAGGQAAGTRTSMGRRGGPSVAARSTVATSMAAGEAEQPQSPSDEESRTPPAIGRQGASRLSPTAMAAGPGLRQSPGSGPGGSARAKAGGVSAQGARAGGPPGRPAGALSPSKGSPGSSSSNSSRDIVEAGSSGSSNGGGSGAPGGGAAGTATAAAAGSSGTGLRQPGRSSSGRERKSVKFALPLDPGAVVPEDEAETDEEARRLQGAKGGRPTARPDRESSSSEGESRAAREQQPTGLRPKADGPGGAEARRPAEGAQDKGSSAQRPDMQEADRGSTGGTAPSAEDLALIRPDWREAAARGGCVGCGEVDCRCRAPSDKESEKGRHTQGGQVKDSSPRNASTKGGGENNKGKAPGLGSDESDDAIPPSALAQELESASGEQGPSPVGTLKWKRGELLGEGAYGKVFLGLNEMTGELMAVKQIKMSQAGDERAMHIASLEREIVLYRKMRHRHIVAYIDMERDEADGSLYVFLEFVSGGSIHSMLEKFGKFSESLVRVYTRQLLLGLEYLHRCKIIHRDIKGGNVLVDRDGIIKLADFGASKKFNEGTLTEGCKSIRGSVFWMAPEVIKGDGYGRKADIWSLGCTVIEMLTGSHPWPNMDNTWSAIFHIAKTTTGPPLPEDCSDIAKDFLTDCFRLDPKERPSATEMLQHPFVQVPDTPRDARIAAAFQ